MAERRKGLKDRLQLLDDILKNRTYSVGDSIILVDLLFTCTLQRVFKHILAPEDRMKLPNLTRLYTHMVEQPKVKAAIGDVKLTDKLGDVEEHFCNLSRLQVKSTTNDLLVIAILTVYGISKQFYEFLHRYITLSWCLIYINYFIE